jgi:hypothetical protein
MADQNPSTLKLSSILPAISITRAFITKRNNPNVRMVTGMVNITKSGFNRAFSKLITNVTPISGIIPFRICIPGIKYAPAATARQLIRNFVNILMIYADFE